MESTGGRPGPRDRTSGSRCPGTTPDRKGTPVSSPRPDPSPTAPDPRTTTRPPPRPGTSTGSPGSRETFQTTSVPTTKYDTLTDTHYLCGQGVRHRSGRGPTRPLPTTRDVSQDERLSEWDTHNPQNPSPDRWTLQGLKAVSGLTGSSVKSLSLTQDVRSPSPGTPPSHPVRPGHPIFPKRCVLVGGPSSFLPGSNGLSPSFRHLRSSGSTLLCLGALRR